MKGRGRERGEIEGSASEISGSVNRRIARVRVRGW